MTMRIALRPDAAPAGRHGEGDGFAALADDASDAIARISPDGRLVYVNASLARWMRRSITAVVGTDITRLRLPIHVLIGYRRRLRRVFATGVAEAFGFIVAVDKLSRHFEVRVVPEVDPEGHVLSVLVVTSDVTTTVLLCLERDALRHEVELARQADASFRKHYLSTVSHELRTPLNAIQNWSHVLDHQLGASNAANPTAVRALEGIRAGVSEQVRLIEHLLDSAAAGRPSPVKPVH